MDSLNIAIYGYKSPLVGRWDPDNVTTGLPGSEECVIYASQELASRGHKVTVYMDPPSDSSHSLAQANPRWVDVDQWVNPDNSAIYDIVIMWRIYNAQWGRIRGKRVILWLHDSPDQPNPRVEDYASFDGVFFLSEHHKEQHQIYPKLIELPHLICGNGFLPEHFDTSVTLDNPLSVGYFSNYARGLGYLLAVWPEVVARFPSAQLNICYGRETWGSLENQDLATLVEMIESSSSIIEHGKIGHQQLADVMKQTSVWAYPCNTEVETFCITAVKCQAAGCIPVVTRIGALNETVSPEAIFVAPITGREGLDKFKEELLSILKLASTLPVDVVSERRQVYRDYAAKYTWKACVDKWLNFFGTLLNPTK